MVIMANSQNKDAAYEFVNWMLDASHHRWAAENILYKVPNAPAMEALDPALLEQFPNMGIPPADLLAYEQLRDVGEAQRDYARLVTEIRAAQ
jgi:spermidine/putrescine transport system substrate-binding protein